LGVGVLGVLGVGKGGGGRGSEDWKARGHRSVVVKVEYSIVVAGGEGPVLS
jgi:hypothetical protein